MRMVAQHPVVMTGAGEVRGAITEGMQVFKGIPYAAPPFGANRFRPPQPVTPWTGVRDALTFGPMPPQPPLPPQVSALLPLGVLTGEDCLTLDIWTPDDATSTAHPVMVWISGGFFEHGGTAWYDGSRFARDGVVCVTINYRVGADGFLFLEDGDANRGLLDQIAALAWVRDNIAAFGGDPTNVTIFGESAGGMSVGTLLAMPRAEGLFRRAIIESGTAHHVTTPATAQRIRHYLAERLGIEATREGFAAVPVEHLLAAQVALKGELDTHPSPERWAEVAVTLLPFEPVIDGTSLPARPIDRLRAGASAGVDILVGTNTEEMRVALVPSGAIDQITDEALAHAIAAYGLPLDAALATYRATNTGASAGDLFAAIWSDWYWRIPALRVAEAHAEYSAATYVYEFAWRSPQFDGRLGACHGLEVPFVFDTLSSEGDPMLGSKPPQPLADTMHGAWVAFATTGDPGWPRYDLRRRAAMRFDAVSHVVDDPLSTQRVLWEVVR